jgi:hypothetical protein
LFCIRHQPTSPPPPPYLRTPFDHLLFVSTFNNIHILCGMESPRSFHIRPIIFALRTLIIATSYLSLSPCCLGRQATVSYIYMPYSPPGLCALTYVPLPIFVSPAPTYHTLHTPPLLSHRGARNLKVDRHVAPRFTTSPRHCFRICC